MCFVLCIVEINIFPLEIFIHLFSIIVRKYRIFDVTLKFLNMYFKLTLEIIFLANYNKLKKWERSSVWLERLPVTQEVASSSLVVPAIIRKLSMGFIRTSES